MSLRCTHGFPMGSPMGPYGILMGSLWGFNESLCGPFGVPIRGEADDCLASCNPCNLAWACLSTLMCWPIAVGALGRAMAMALVMPGNARSPDFIATIWPAPPLAY